MKQKALRISLIILIFVVAAIAAFVIFNLQYTKNYAYPNSEGYVLLTKSQFSYIEKSDNKDLALKEIMDKYDLQFTPNRAVSTSSDSAS